MQLPRTLPVRAVTFDAAGTLIRLARPVGETYAEVASRRGIAADPGRLDVAFRSVWNRTPPPFSASSGGSAAETAAPVPDSEKEWWRRLVGDVFVEAGSSLPARAFPAFFEELFTEFARPGVWIARPGALEAVEGLSARLPCAVLSNFDDRLRTILADLDLLGHFRHVVLSAEVRASKPDRRIFDRARELLGVPAGDILHVGDDPVRDGEGARDAGFRYAAVHPDRDHPLDEILELSLARL